MNAEQIRQAQKTGYVRNLDNDRIFIYNKPFNRCDNMVPCEAPTFKQVDPVKARLKEPVGTPPAVGDPNRLTLIVEAIGKLDRIEGYTKSGTPKLEALNEILGWTDKPVVMSERDNAWKLYLEKVATEV